MTEREDLPAAIPPASGAGEGQQAGTQPAVKSGELVERGGVAPGASSVLSVAVRSASLLPDKDLSDGVMSAAVVQYLENELESSKKEIAYLRGRLDLQQLANGRLQSQNSGLTSKLAVLEKPWIERARIVAGGALVGHGISAGSLFFVAVGVVLIALPWVPEIFKRGGK
jgi:hypothetical protein